MNRWPEVYQYRQMLARLWVLSEPNRAYELLVSDMPHLIQHLIIMANSSQCAANGRARLSL